MTSPNGETVDVAVENHPIYHEWTRVRDYVVERTSRGRILLIKRYQYCEHCPTERIDLIDVGTWRRVRSPRYVYTKGVTIQRMNKAIWARQRFLATTDLPAEDVQPLERARLSA